MCTARAVTASLLVAALACATTRADDAHPSSPAQSPDAGFLEFLGGVDGLADVNPDYLSQGNPAHPATSPAQPPAKAPAAPPATPAGAKHDE